jgi:uroporphyrinogen-III synthase
MTNKLNGKRILVTRPQQQAHNLISLIEQHGGQAIAFPTLEIISITHQQPIKEKLENLKSYQWLIFTSANAVNFALQANGGKIETFKSVKIAAVGQATATALQQSGLSVDLVPRRGFNSEALLVELEEQLLPNSSVLIVRGVGGRETLAEGLRKQKIKVDYLEVYQRVIPKLDCSSIIYLIQQQQIAVITVSSAEALYNLLGLLDPVRVLLLQIPLVVISQRIQKLAQTCGFNRIAVAANPADAAIFETITIVCNGEDSGRRNY